MPHQSSICYSSDGFLGAIINSGLPSLEKEKIKQKSNGPFPRPLPHHPTWRENIFILKWTVVPLIIQEVFHTLWGAFDLPSWIIHTAQYVLYFLSFVHFAARTQWRFDRFVAYYGCLNEDKIARDRVTDERHGRLMVAFSIYAIVRTSGLFMLTSDHFEPAHLDLFSIVRIICFILTMDYFFFLYHFMAHRFDIFWAFHRFHHVSRAPVATLSLYSHDLQDLIEWLIVPFLAFQISPLSFTELYLVSSYTMYGEALAHSGIRAHLTLHPGLAPILGPLGLQNTVEDHDIHHRFGRKSENFGKLTKFWDVVFSTAMPRLEGIM